MMQIGLLWYDNGNSELPLKVSQAVKRYRERFGAEPNVCYVPPENLPNGEQQVEGVAVRASPRILRHHLWVGREQLSQEYVAA